MDCTSLSNLGHDGDEVCLYGHINHEMETQSGLYAEVMMYKREDAMIHLSTVLMLSSTACLICCNSSRHVFLASAPSTYVSEFRTVHLWQNVKLIESAH